MNLSNIKPNIEYMSLNRKLLLAVLAASSAVTAVITVVNLYLEYRSELSIQKSEIQYLEKSFIDSLKLSLWTLDNVQTSAQVKGMLSIPSVVEIKIVNKYNEVIFNQKKEYKAESVYTKIYDLKFENENYTTDLGTLDILITNDFIYDRLKESALKIFISQGIKTLIISFILLYIFKMYVTNYLTELKTFLQKYNPITKDTPKFKIVKKSKYNDEIDSLVESVNQTIEASIANQKKMEQTEEELLKKKFNLEVTNKELKEFAYIASHDLQAPLRHVSAYVGVLKEELPQEALNKDAQEAMRFITSGVEKMRNLINDLLIFSQAGNSSLKIGNNNLNILVSEIVTMFINEIKAKNAKIIVGPLPIIFCDYERISQVFQNLIGNALKYHNKTKQIEISINAEELDQHWQFSVTDNGIGIPKAQKERVFQIFQRLHTDAEYSGTGIGLSICRKIIDIHGGKIWVESEEGKGSTFYFTILKTLNERRAYE